MATKEPFPIDLADLDSIRSKIPEVESIVESKREEVSVAQREFAYWQAILDRMRLIAGQRIDGGKKGTGSKETALDLVVRIVNESAVPVRAAEVGARLDNTMKRETINWALWKAFREGKIEKISTGRYAPLGYINETEQERLVES